MVNMHRHTELFRGKDAAVGEDTAIGRHKERQLQCKARGTLTVQGQAPQTAPATAATGNDKEHGQYQAMAH